MSIPRIIHYCWFGHAPKPELAQRCIASWKRYCPNYEIIEWNESNFSIAECPRYVQDAYSQKLYAFVSDFVRLKVVYEYGGIYLDTDVEIIRPLDAFLEYSGFFGFEDGVYINTGLGFGAVPQLPLLNDLMRDYWEISLFNPDASINYTASPKINIHVFVDHGLRQNNKKQVLEANVLILPSEYMCPINYHTDKMKITRRTVSIHWFSKSWMTEESKLAHEQRKKEIKIDFWKHLPNRILLRILGKCRYEELKKLLGFQN